MKGKNLELQNGAKVSEGVEHAAGSNRHLEIMRSETHPNPALL